MYSLVRTPKSFHCYKLLAQFTQSAELVDCAIIFASFLPSSWETAICLRIECVDTKQLVPKVRASRHTRREEGAREKTPLARRHSMNLQDSLSSPTFEIPFAA